MGFNKRHLSISWLEVVNDLLSPAVIRELVRAWRESEAEIFEHRHEEGGYVVETVAGAYSAIRWSRGEQAAIIPPALDSERRYNGILVVAAFHTHPNPPVDEAGQEWEQRPSRSDVRWHAKQKLPGIVVCAEFVFGIEADGRVVVLGKHDEVLRP